MPENFHNPEKISFVVHCLDPTSIESGSEALNIKTTASSNTKRAATTLNKGSWSPSKEDWDDGSSFLKMLIPQTTGVANVELMTFDILGDVDFEVQVQPEDTTNVPKPITVMKVNVTNEIYKQLNKQFHQQFKQRQYTLAGNGACTSLVSSVKSNSRCL